LGDKVKLIVGLGNPTARYEQTRHNAGFWFLDEVAARNHLSFGMDARTRSMLAKWEWQGGQVLLLKPMQYMNLSGDPVAALARYYRIAPQAILVAHDELDFAPGMVKLKRGGGHGGHNGVRDIAAKLGTADFFRLRIGIGHPGHRDQVTNYVLDRPSRPDLDLVRQAIARAADALPLLLCGDIALAMNRLHGTQA
jgi:PTH1 family peptidyl-tRNA hydrolase